MTRPQPLTHAIAAGMPEPVGTQLGWGGAGGELLGFSTEHSEQSSERVLPGCQLPRKPHTCYTRAVGRLKAIASAVQSAHHFIPRDQGGDQSAAGLPSKIWEQEGATRLASQDLSCTRPVRERPLACRRARGTSSVASRRCPRASAARGAKKRALLLLLPRLLSAAVLHAPHLHGVQRVHKGVLQNPGHRSRCHVGGHRGTGR